MDKKTTRRDLLGSAGMGLAGLLTAINLKDQRLLANPAKPDLVGKSFNTAEKPAPKSAKAKAMISLWDAGRPQSN